MLPEAATIIPASVLTPAGTNNGPGAVSLPQVVSWLFVSTAVASPSLERYNFGMFYLFNVI
jgi:hypothetical protein